MWLKIAIFFIVTLASGGASQNKSHTNPQRGHQVMPEFEVKFMLNLNFGLPHNFHSDITGSK
jgi:hypothetical protein